MESVYLASQSLTVPVSYKENRPMSTHIVNALAEVPAPSLDKTQRAEPVDLAEATASLRVLVHLAKADGDLTAEDKRALHDTLAGALHPSAKTLEYLADEKIDLDSEL